MQKLDIEIRERKEGEDVPSCPKCEYYNSSMEPTTKDYVFLCSGCGNVWYIKQLGRTEIIEI